MKLKEIDRNGFITFSPPTLRSTYLAIGSAYQQYDGSFNNSSHLDLFEYIPSEHGLEMQTLTSQSINAKFTKLLWNSSDKAGGYIVGGDIGGVVSVYDTNVNENMMVDAVTKSLSHEAHKGFVYSMDNNKFKKNLFASGGPESEIFIWDIEKFQDPMTPGHKSQPQEDILSLAWNHKVQHILGSVSAHRCQVWDLRKTDPVIKLSDTQMKIKPVRILWHPEISTRLCLASNDDNTPIIQIWDLRYIQCPYHTLEKHTKGISDMDWSIDDPDILISIGKDSRMICYDMSTHATTNQDIDKSQDVIYENLLDQQHLNEVKFCPKHPSIVAVSSLDCHVSLYTLMGGRNKFSNELDFVTDSFPPEISDDFDELEIVKKEAEKVAERQNLPYPYLSKAPKWLVRPCGASFSFGGKLVQFTKPEGARSRNNSVNQPTGNDVDCRYKVMISGVVVEKRLLDRSHILDNALHSQDTLMDFCVNKISELDNTSQGLNTNSALNIWKFIQCHLYSDSRSSFIECLGYQVPDEDMNYQKTNNDRDESGLIKDEGNDFDQSSSPTGLDLLPSTNKNDETLSVALMTGDMRNAVDLCLKENRFGEACVLAVSSGDQELYYEVQDRILSGKLPQDSISQLINIAVKRNWTEMVNRCSLGDWKEALTWLLTYSNGDELPDLCEVLGRRLEDASEGNTNYYHAACICYICAGSIDNFVNCYLRTKPLSNALDYQNIMEMSVLLCKSIGQDGFSFLENETKELFLKYAKMLVSQGNLKGALNYLEVGPCSSNYLELKHRICENLRENLPENIDPPKSIIEIQPLFKGTVQNKFPLKFANNLNTSMNSQVLPGKTLTTSPLQISQQNCTVPNQDRMNCIPPYCGPKQELQYSTTGNMNFPTSPVSKSGPMDGKFYQPCVQPTSGVFSPSHTFNKNVNESLTHDSIAKLPSQFPTGNCIITNYNNTRSGWNDPPILSDSYYDGKPTIQTQFPNFYNPANFNSLNDIKNMDVPSAVLFNSSVPGAVMKGGSDTTGVLPPSADSQQLETIKTVLMQLIHECKEKDKSRVTKVRMEEHEKKLSEWFHSRKTGQISGELMKGLSIIVTYVTSKDFQSALSELNKMVQYTSFTEAGNLLPCLKMLLQNSNKIFEK